MENKTNHDEPMNNEKVETTAAITHSSDKSFSKLLLVIAFGLVLVGLGLVAGTIDGWWPFGIQETTTPQQTTRREEPAMLSIEAGLVYKFGGAQPVARTPFYVLDESPLDIRRENGLTSFPEQPLVGFVLQLELERVAEIAMRSQGRDTSKSTGRLDGHIAASGTTGFDGRLSFSNLPSGQYYLFGYTDTRSEGGMAIWSLPINLHSGNQSVVLDQNNADYVR